MNEMMSSAPKPEELTPEQQKTMRARFLSDAKYAEKGAGTEFGGSRELKKVYFTKNQQAEIWKNAEIEKKASDFYEKVLKPINEKIRALNEGDENRFEFISELEEHVVSREEKGMKHKDEEYLGEAQLLRGVLDKAYAYIEEIREAHKVNKMNDKDQIISKYAPLNSLYEEVRKMKFLDGIEFVHKISLLCRTYAKDKGDTRYQKYAPREGDSNIKALATLAREHVIAEQKYDEATIVEMDHSVEGGFREKK